MVALEVLITLALLVIAGTLIFTKKFTVEINVNVHEKFEHDRNPAPLPTSATLQKLTEEEQELYESSYSVIGALNKILQTGELPSDPEKKEELK